MTDSTLTTHRRPNESCLEPFRKQIAERRRLLWPYRKLAQWLADEHQVTIAWPTIRSFCQVRNIHKGTGEIGITKRTPDSAVKKKPADPKAWDFNTEGPLEVYRHQN